MTAGCASPQHASPRKLKKSKLDPAKLEAKLEARTLVSPHFARSPLWA